MSQMNTRVPSVTQTVSKAYVRGQEPAPSLLHHYRGHRGNINAVAFHPHSETIYSAGADKYIMSWNFKKETRALRSEMQNFFCCT